MKKIFTILTVVALTTTVSFSQTQWGGTVGLNMANISGSDADVFSDKESRLGIRVGLTFSKELSDVVTLNSGVLYSVKGLKYKFIVFDYDAFGNLYAIGDLEADFSVNYIELPVNFAFSLAEQFSLTAGFYSAILVGTSSTVDGRDFDIGTEDLTTIDVGINLGAQVSLTDAISIHAGYQMGLIALDEDGETNMKNSNILVGMTYSFGG
jgi:hypothetical protein